VVISCGLHSAGGKSTSASIDHKILDLSTENLDLSTTVVRPIGRQQERELGMPDREHVAKIVAAYAKGNALAADQLPRLIAMVHSALAVAEDGEPPAATNKLMPAVPIKRSVRPDAVICLDCGRPQKMLKRHLLTSHQLAVDEYRRRWGLPRDYPLVAPNYHARRSELAKSLGLGRRGAP